MNTLIENYIGGYEKIENILLGEDVYIIGGGVSLIGFDFNKLKGRNIVTVNHSLFDFEERIFNVFLDQRFLREANMSHLDLPLSITSNHCGLSTKDNILVFKSSESYFSANPKKGFYTSKNAVCFAISCCLFAGAKEINVLGADCCSLNKEKAINIALSNGNYIRAEEIKNSNIEIYGHYDTGYRFHSFDNKEHVKIFDSFAKHYEEFEGINNIYIVGELSKIKNLKRKQFSDL